MKRIGVFCLLFALISPTVVKADEVVLTLEEAVMIALRDNRDIRLKESDLEKAKLKITEAKAPLFPSLTFTGVWKDTMDYYPEKHLGQTTTQTSVKQYLYQGGKTVNTIAYYENRVAVTHALLDNARLETILKVQQTFYLLQLSSDFARLNKEILDNTLEHLAFIDARFKTGQASESQILAVRNSLKAVEEAYAASLNQAEAAQALLRNLLFLDDDIGILPQGDFVYEPREIAFDEALLKAMQGRPEIRQYAAQEEADKKLVEVAKADKRPTIYFSWDYYSNSVTSATFSPTKGWNDWGVIGLTFSWPIFDGWETKAKVEQALVDLKATRLIRQKTEKDIVLEVRNAYLEMKDAIAKIKSSQAEVALYTDSLREVKEKTQSGIASSLDFHDAELKYNVALFNRKQAIYDYLIARISLDRATGGGL
ncbi:MAG: TolC family protein [Candidatus Omnitrophota bacterium]